MNQQNYNVNVQTPMCLNRHALSLLVNYCNNCGSNSNPICYKCIPCNYSVCAACAMKLWNINVNSNVNVNINTGGHNVQVQKEEKPAIPCFQCKGGIKFQHRGNRNPICCECKSTTCDFTYCCMNCNLDVCDTCAKKMQEQMMGMMNNFMGGMGGNMGGMGGNMNMGGNMGGGFGGGFGGMGGFGGFR